MNICEHLTVSASNCPEKVAIAFEGKSLTYAQLDELSACASRQLAATGVVPGDRVAIMLPNVPAFVVWYYAALRLGAIAVSISTRLAEREVSFVVADCGAKAFISMGDEVLAEHGELPDCVVQSFVVSEIGDLCDGQPFESSVEPACFDAQPDDAALILYTSGTTGFAKGATLSHNNVRSNVLEFNRLCDMQPTDRILLAVPLFHCFGQNALLNSALNAGATLILQRGFDLNESKRLITQEKVSQLYGVPTMFQLFHESCTTEDLATVRYCFSAAAKLPTQVSQRWLDKFGQPIHEGYGLTETSPFASYNHSDQYVMGTIGEPIDRVEMKIVDSETGSECDVGELGEIVIRGPNVMLGYWNRPDDTAAAIQDGWFHSGDIGRRNRDGYFQIVDRVKDMIVVGGLKVYPAEVERILLDHTAVKQAAVVGFPHEVFGEQVVAFVVAAEATPDSHECNATSILTHCNDHLANYKVPKQCVFLDELPRNPSGKILKTVLREHDLTVASNVLSEDVASGQSNAIDAGLPVRTSPLRPPTLWSKLSGAYANDRGNVASQFLCDLVQALSGTDEELSAETRFLDTGLDSLLIVELSSQIQAEVGPKHEVAATLVFDHPKIGDLAKWLVELFEASEAESGARIDATKSSDPANNHEGGSVRTEVDAMSEEEALTALMKELETN